LVLWSESELWPNTLSEIAARGLPAYLVNARISDKAFRGWSRWPRTARAVLSAFRSVIAQSSEDARRFAMLGAGHVVSSGNLKLAAEPLPNNVEAVAVLKDAIGARPAWLAASIHPGEDAVVARVHRALAAKHPGVLTLVAPRHPEKAEQMAAAFAAAGLAVARRSAGQAIAGNTHVYLADTLGELGVLYRACDLVVMGKSFAVGGGQNPAEPAKLGCAVICGPDMSNFRELTADLVTAGAVSVVADTEALTQRLSALMADPAARRRQGENGARFMAAGAAALAETLAILAPTLANPLDCP
jgi:3-deoxy-D-manno-octulosonic-acid transferase